MSEEKIPRQLRVQLIEQARKFREEPTEAEKLLWEHIRRRQVGGIKFRRQHIIYKFIVDFYCPAAKLVVEVDGPVHYKQKEHDQERELYLRKLGYRVLRFKNEEVFEDIEKVLAAIFDSCID